jgi:hypothetical protein
MLKTKEWFIVEVQGSRFRWIIAQMIHHRVMKIHNPSIKEIKMPLALLSSAFDDGGQIPPAYTCEGENISPPLSLEGAPADTKSLVLIVDDPDAPDPRAPRMTWVHWVVYNISPNTSGFVAGASHKSLPSGAEEGINDWKERGYGGPCPPIGRHRYFYKLYALDIMLPTLDQPTKANVLAAIKGHVIEEAVLKGTYQKSH